MKERRYARRSVLVTVALATSLAAQAPAVIHSSKRLHLHFHAGALPPALAGSLGKAALAATEKAWPLVDRTLGTSKIQIANLHWYADRADYAFGEYRYFPGHDRELFLELGYRRGP